MSFPGDVLPRPYLAKDAMLGSVKCHQVDFGRFPEPLPARHPFAIHSGRIGHQPHPLTLELPEAAIGQDIDAQAKDGPVGFLSRQKSRAKEKENQDNAAVHVRE